MSDGDKDDPLRGPETEPMRLAAADVTLAWADIENLMAKILQHILGADNAITSAIYFAPNSIETRLTIVDQAFRALVEHQELPEKRAKEIVDAWSDIQKTLSRIKKARNHVAHGEIIVAMRRGKEHIRFAAPLADYASHKEARRRRQLPGMSVNDLRKSAKTVAGIARRLTLVIPLIDALLAANDEALREILPRLSANRPS